MNANEMAIELELRLDRSSSFGSPGYEDFELTSVLSDAERFFVKKFINRKNNRKGESFEETEIRNQGLSALIKRGAGLAVSASQTDVIVNGQFFDLPIDFMYCIYEDATIDKVLCNTEDTKITAIITPVAHDEITRLRKNKYKKPFYKSYGDCVVWRLVFSRDVDGYDPAIPATEKRHQLITDGTFNIDAYSINYLMFPKGIIVDRDTPLNQRNCILDESTHSAIIDIAVNRMLDRVKEQAVKNIESFSDLE